VTTLPPNLVDDLSLVDSCGRPAVNPPIHEHLLDDANNADLSTYMCTARELLNMLERGEAAKKHNDWNKKKTIWSSR
jgi:hypothetical protein